MRLDKYLAQSGERSRSEAARAVRAGLVRVRGELARDPAMQLAPADEVTLRGQVVADSALQYFMLHKPAGVLTAARDSRAQTVMSLVPSALLKRDVLPVGRLDKDTTGLLLLTNDGALAHDLLSPKKHVWKRYVLSVSGKLDADDVRAFAEGVQLSDFTAKPAKLLILEISESQSRAEVEIREGKFHQIKRMCAARGHEVLALHRASFGSLTLDETLAPGQFRALTPEELAALRRCAQAPQKEGNTDA